MKRVQLFKRPPARGMEVVGRSPDFVFNFTRKGETVWTVELSKIASVCGRTITFISGETVEVPGMFYCMFASKLASRLDFQIVPKPPTLIPKPPTT